MMVSTLMIIACAHQFYSCWCKIKNKNPWTNPSASRHLSSNISNRKSGHQKSLADPLNFIFVRSNPWFFPRRFAKKPIDWMIMPIVIIRKSYRKCRSSLLKFINPPGLGTFFWNKSPIGWFKPWFPLEPREYSLGVTQLLDDLLGKQEKRPDEDWHLGNPWKLTGGDQGECWVGWLRNSIFVFFWDGLGLWNWRISSFSRLFLWDVLTIRPAERSKSTEF